MNVLVRSVALAAALALPVSAARAALAPLPPGPALPAPVEPHRHDRSHHRLDEMSKGLHGGRLAPVMVRDGVLFRYESDDASTVSVVGEFNGWDETANPMTRHRDGIWRTVVDLEPGKWPYLFSVDGQWVRDPDNPVITVAHPAGRDTDSDVSMVYVKRDEVALPRPHGFRDGSTDLSGSYDRVNQVTLTGALRYRNRVQMHPDLDVVAGYAFGRDRWLYDVGFAQPLLGGGVLDVGAQAYRRSATPDEFRVGSTENSLAAFFFRQDWRDYYEAEGVSTFLRCDLGPDQEILVRARREDHRSVAKTTDWGLFEGKTRMRANPAVDDGRLRAVAASYELDTRNHRTNPSRGLLATASWEWVGDGLGGDFAFQRGELDVRRYIKLSPDHFLDIRLLGAMIDQAHRTVDGLPLRGFAAIPLQERLYLGGIGTMRATQFKSLVGDRATLANVEMRVGVFDDFQAVVFTDVGDAWVEAADTFHLKTDAGVGVQDSDASFRINVAKKVDGREGDEGVLVSVRINRMF
jgi:Omp85 superfamily domain/Glycogen recognition site of AMP-activated protein kinase